MISEEAAHNIYNTSTTIDRIGEGRTLRHRLTTSPKTNGELCIVRFRMGHTTREFPASAKLYRFKNLNGSYSYYLIGY
jgi:hypothetical protein